MKSLLEAIYGNKLEKYKAEKLSLPLYLLDGREIVDVSICGCSFNLVILKSLNRFNVRMLMKQIVNYEQKLQKPIAYGFGRITTFQRKSLIENNIPFVAANGQIYLPFLGSYFDLCVKHEQTYGEKFSPTSQMLFLLFLYGNNTYSKSAAATRLRVSPMSITRASRQLLDANLIREEKNGNEVTMAISADRQDFFNKAENMLISPVQSVTYTLNNRCDVSVPESGEFSLSKRTDFGYPEYVEYAFYKNYFEQIRIEEIDPDTSNSTNIVRIQKWKYDPTLFSLNGQVDPVSLICSLRDTKDERIHKCLETVKEEIAEWLI